MQAQVLTATCARLFDSRGIKDNVNSVLALINSGIVPIHTNNPRTYAGITAFSLRVDCIAHKSIGVAYFFITSVSLKHSAKAL